MSEWQRLVSCLALTLSLACSSVPSAIDVPPTPAPSYEFWMEMARLEQSPVCRLIRDYGLEEMVPYYEGIETMRLGQ